MGRSALLKILVGVCTCTSLILCACGPIVFQSVSVGEPVLYGVDYSTDVMWERFLSEEGSYSVADGLFGDLFGVILPHHLVTALELTRFYRGVSEVMQPKLVVIVSPNHYEAGEAVFQTCNCSYETFDGVNLETSGEDLEGVLLSGLVQLANENFEIEHGVFAHANFIKRFFPEAEILPVIVKGAAGVDELDALVEYFERKYGERFGKDVLFVASVDFAHYMTKEVSDPFDEVSFEVVAGFEYNSYWDVELDSPGSIYLVSRLASDAGFGQVSLVEHTNSQDYFQKFVEETTSHLYITFSRYE